MKTSALAVLLTLYVAGTPIAQAAGDVAAGQSKSAACAGCHGADGNSVNPTWPKLAGQHYKYLVKEISDFKAGKRNNATMAPMASGLGEEDIQNLAAYFASQKPTGGFAKEENVAMGERIYRAGKPVDGMAACMSCHGPSGAGNPYASIPAIAGQHTQYNVTQLRSFRSGERANDRYAIMRTVAQRMTDKEIEAVAEYMAGLH